MIGVSAAAYGWPTLNQQHISEQQRIFIHKAIKALRRVLKSCEQKDSTVSEELGRKHVGNTVVVVTLIAEIERGFSAPIGSHGSSVSKLSSESPTNSLGNRSVEGVAEHTPDYSRKTTHHNSKRTSRWHKPHF